jgi:DNA-binding MarR family transcriptional regulator
MSPEPIRIADSLSFLVNKVAQIAGKGMTEALAPMGIGPKESGILAALAQFGPLGQHHLGELLLVDRTTMVLCVDRLEELGLVERADDPTDRRRFLITLTERGEQAVPEAKQRLAEFEERLLQPLSPEDRIAFRSALYTIVAESLAAEARAKGAP